MSEVSPAPERPQPSLEEATSAARFNRLAGIVRRIRWTKVGVPAVADAETKVALTDLFEWQLMNAIDAALAARTNKEGEDG
ncbi:MAG: hypothetical protein E7K72_19335 [Roseomonas mucosa]|nr:hypothetical protein [Roseomonas mucosa]